MIEDIEKYLRKRGIKNYTINSNGLIDVDGNVTYRGGEYRIPSGIQFGHVSGFFSCTWGNLTSLVGAPLSLGGHFRCYSNDISPIDENFEVIYRYDYGNIAIGLEISDAYDAYYKARKRIETINEILK